MTPTYLTLRTKRAQIKSISWAHAVNPHHARVDILEQTYHVYQIFILSFIRYIASWPRSHDVGLSIQFVHFDFKSFYSESVLVYLCFSDKVACNVFLDTFTDRDH